MSNRKINDEEVWEEIDWGAEEGSVKGSYPLLESVIKAAFENDGKISEEEWAIIEALRKSLNVSGKVLKKLMNEIKTDLNIDNVVFPDGLNLSANNSTESIVYKSKRDEDNISLRDEEATPVIKKYPNLVTPFNLVRGGNKPPLTKTFDFNMLEKDTLLWCEICGVISPQEVKSTTLLCPHCGRVLKDLTNRKPTPTAEWLLKEGKKYFRRGELEKARLLYKDVIKRDHTNKEAHFFLKKIYTLMNEDDKKKNLKIRVKFLKKIKWGLKELDNIMNGGINPGSQVLVLGSNFSGQELILKNVAVTSLNLGFPLLYITTNRLMKEVVREIIPNVPAFSKLNRDKLFRIIDLFSSGEEITLKEGHEILHLNGPDDLNKLKKAIEACLDFYHKNYGVGVVVINSLTGIFNRAGIKNTFNLLNPLIARMKQYNVTAIYSIIPESHSASMINSLEYIMTGSIKIKVENDRNFLKISGFGSDIKNREWIEYIIRDDKISIVGAFTKQLIK